MPRLAFWLTLCWIPCILTGLAESDLNASVSTLEIYKRRLQNLKAQAGSDPQRLQQIHQLQRLLTFMQRSVVLTSESNAPTPEEHVSQVRSSPPKAPSPVPKPAESTPLPDVSPPKETKKPLADTPPPTLTPIQRSPKQAPPPPADASVPRDDAIAPPPEPPRWLFQSKIGLAVGYQRNLLCSAFSDLDSAVVYGEGDLSLLNVRRTQQRYTAIGRYTRTHFLDDSSVQDEDILFLLGEADFRWHDDWWLGATTSYFSAHQPFDDPEVADLDGASTPLHFRQWALAPRLLWEPSEEHQWSFALGLQEEWTDGLDFESQDNSQWFARLGYTFQPNSRHRWRLDYHYAETDYDERTTREPNGVSQGRSLETRTHDWQMSYRHTWHLRHAHRWRTEARLRAYRQEDVNGGGYDDYWRMEARARLSWQYGGGSALSADLRYGHYEYDSREVSFLDPERRSRSYLAGSLTWEHRLSANTSWWMRYDFRENDGNKALDRYDTQTLYAGLRWHF